MKLLLFFVTLSEPPIVVGYSREKDFCSWCIIYFLVMMVNCYFYTFFPRYCYLLNDLTSDLLMSKCSNYEELQNYLRLSGREAYLQKRVSYLRVLVMST